MKGYISVEYTFWCGGCDKWVRFASNRKKYAQGMARKSGWSSTTRDGWLCPMCSMERKKNSSVSTIGESPDEDPGWIVEDHRGNKTWVFTK